MLRNVVDHFQDLNCALSAILSKKNLTYTEDILIDESKYSSDMVLRSVDEMSDTINRLEKKLSKFNGEEVGFSYRKSLEHCFRMVLIFFRRRNRLTTHSYGEI